MNNGESIEELRNWHKAVMDREARLIEAQKKLPNIGA